MRHGIAGKTFGRNQKWRQATVRDIAKAVLIHQQIRTTRVKAGEARKLVDKLITLGKKNTLAAKRRAYAILCNHKLVSTLFNTIAPRFASRQGGYTRLIKFALNRRGDNAEMVILELTETDLAPVKVAEEASAEVEDAEVVEEKASKAKKPKAKAEPKSKAVKEEKGSSKKTKTKE